MGAALVARSREAAALDRALGSAKGGRRSTVFVTGPPGIGKSALVDATVGRWRGTSDLRVARGRCQESSGAKEPYLPFLEAVGELCTEPRASELLRQMAPTWFVQFPWLLSGDDRTQLARELHGATTGRMLRELDAFLQRLSAERPIVLALEDMHWSDPDSVDLLSYLVSRDAAAGLLLVVTARPVELIVHDHPLRHAKRDLALSGRCEELALELFTEDEVRALARQRLGSDELPGSMLQWLYERTEGHPLFVLHLLDHLLATEHLVAEAGAWSMALPLDQLGSLLPDSLPGLVEKNLERCTKTERAMLEGAALAGYQFTSVAVAHATGEEVEHVEDAMDRLANRGDFVLGIGPSELPGGLVAAQYRFRHAILRDCLRKGVAPTRRARSQRLLAEKGEELFGENAHEVAAQLAEHFEGALLFGKAVHYHRVAAENAARRYASGTAVEHLRTALGLVTRLPRREPRGRRTRPPDVACPKPARLRRSGRGGGAL